MIVDAWLPRAAAARPAATAIEAGGRTLTYEQLLAAALTGSHELRERGVLSGQSVAIALPPGIDFAIALHACWLAGASAVPIDLRLSERERESHAVGTATTIEAGDALGVVGAAPDPTADRGLSRAASRLTAREAAGETSNGAPAARLVHDLDAVAAVIHTSGTTSAPKRVELSFGNFLWSALGSAVALGSGPEERWLSTLPVCHVGGLSILVRSAIGASTAVVHERFEAKAALAALMHERVTLVSVVATTLARLLDAGLREPPSLRVALAGGGPVPAALLQRAAQAGVPVSQTYGLTESCSQASTVPLAALRAIGGDDPALGGTPGAQPATGAAATRAEALAGLGAGRPLFCARLATAADGEILLAGPTIARGSLSADGWLHTGDLGSVDEQGNLHVTGRKADTIISGGENVAPAEVEAVLEAHADVLEAAVLARSDPDWGEAVTAIVVPRPGARPSEQELRSHCAASLATFKVPKRVVLAGEPLPRTRSGKLLRRELG
jgi:O-succinylbenzoic acid--CoA ligase